MEIIVLVKQVPDVALNIKVKEGEIVEEGLSYVISSWDETALEAALQITEDVGGEVTLLTVGPDKAAESLRKGLAMEHTKRFTSNMIKLEKLILLLTQKFCKKLLRDATMILYSPVGSLRTLIRD